MKISVVVPAYNEVCILKDSIEKIREFLEKMKYNYEIIIANDGSTDGTTEVAERLVKKYKRIRHLRLKHVFKGGAIKNAFANAVGDILIFTDADLSGDLSVINMFVNEIKGGYDICIASRYLNSSEVKRSFSRYIASKIYNFLIRSLFDIKITDFQCGFKAFHRRTLSIILTCRNNSWSWDTELLVMSHKLGLKIKEIPIKWTEGKHSKVNLFKQSIEMIFSLLKMKLSFIKYDIYRKYKFDLNF